MADSDCIFCQILAGAVPATIVDEDERTVSFMDIAPATRGHALVIPRTHTADLLSVGAEDLQAEGAPAGRRGEPRELLRLRRLADGFSFPRPRHSALRG
jgi:hypothetical protein